MEDDSLFILHTVIIMAADDLVTQGARASATILLSEFSKKIPASAPQGLLCNTNTEENNITITRRKLWNNLSHGYNFIHNPSPEPNFSRNKVLYKNLNKSQEFYSRSYSAQGQSSKSDPYNTTCRPVSSPDLNSRAG